MTKEDISKLLELALEYYKLEVFGTGKEFQPPTQERIDYIYERIQSSLPSNINEAVEEFYPDFSDSIASKAAVDSIRDAFRAGAEWQKEQMLKEAISCNVIWHDGPLLDYTQEQQDNALEKIGATIGDKVRIIIVKEK